MATESLPRALVEAELARLCDGERLRRSPSHLRLLRYLVHRALDGDHAALSETAIGIAVFRREPGVYDPQDDPIVRVSIGRLRARLADVYRGAGALPLRIVLPRGRYVPRFEIAGGVSRAPVVVLPVRSASERPESEAFRRAFRQKLREALVRAGTPVAKAVRASGAGRHGAMPVRPRSGAGLPMLDTVLSSDANGHLRLTTRLLDGAGDNVRWIETAAGDGAGRDALGERIIARVLDRLGGAEAASATD